MNDFLAFIVEVIPNLYKMIVICTFVKTASEVVPFCLFKYTDKCWQLSVTPIRFQSELSRYDLAL